MATCTCGDTEHAHLCMLRSNSLLEKIAEITTSPRYYCFVCGGEANCAENLCEPAPITT